MMRDDSGDNYRRYPPNPAQRQALADMRAITAFIGETEVELTCFICGIEATMTRAAARAAGWRLGRMRRVRRGVREQVDLCPDPECNIGVYTPPRRAQPP